MDKQFIFKQITYLVLLILIFSSCNIDHPEQGDDHDLVFNYLPQSWDEAIPLGNGMLGALVWQKEGRLRFSLDRVDLWDLRPMSNLDFSRFTYNWVYEQWENNTYNKVQEQMDVPYDKRVAPTKIPAAALEFDISSLGEPILVKLDVEKAICIVKWDSGTELQVFVNAAEIAGWYRFINCPHEINPEIIAPAYTLPGGKIEKNVIFNADLSLLGYESGKIIREENEIEYKQEGWGGFEYNVDVKWDKKNKTTHGCWSISSSFPGWEERSTAKEMVNNYFEKGFDKALESHKEWWDSYWLKSSVTLPDSIIEKQYYLEMYKFGSAARSDTPPISLQAVWTADNGKLPPWKGDFHHDLNTQLSYWPSYAGNHTDLGEGFVNWLWKYKPAFEEYTMAYYGSDGLNVPGVTTLTGEPMGGWIQYSLGPTVSAWLAHHFYLQWKYTMDREFLEQRAFPWLAATARHFDNIAVKSPDGLLKLPISSSPEINNNSKEAWFGKTTNFDLSLIRWTYEKAAELAQELGLKNEAENYSKKLDLWPELAIDESGLLFAPGYPYSESHRHFSHLMGFHPLGLIDYSKGEDQKKIINNTLKTLEKNGSDYWTGYSFSWQANLYARAFMGDSAAKSLRIFAQAFCLPNSFHVNGDQTKSGYSKFTYRPFTLEGNFAFASGVQEMLIQSHTGIIKIFPAIPSDWENVSFDKLRTTGAFLVSAEMKAGKVISLKVESLAGGRLRLELPFDTDNNRAGEIIEKETQKRDIIIFTPQTK